MRLLLDNNLSPRLAHLLAEAGHDVAHVRELGLHASPDPEVMEAARTSGRVLVSADTDFGTLLSRTGASLPSVLLVRRLSGRRVEDQAAVILGNLSPVTGDLLAGAVVVLGERTVRVRPLPIELA